MRSLKHLLLPALLCLPLLGPAHAADSTLQHWLDGPQRSEANRTRDAARKPAETLAFFGLQPGLTVIEIWPSVGAWWFEVLAPYLRDTGQYIAALHAGAHNPPAARAEHEAIEGRIARQPALYGKVRIAHSPGLPDSVAPDSADLLLTFMNLHNWITDGNADEVVEEFHRVLKPGGVFMSFTPAYPHAYGPFRPACG